MTASTTPRRALSKPRPQGFDQSSPASATRILAGAATIYLVPGRSDYVVRAPGDVDAVTVATSHADELLERYPTEEVPLSSTPAWPELSDAEFIGGEA